MMIARSYNELKAQYKGIRQFIKKGGNESYES